MGENGAGKSTLIKVMTGAHRADEGSMEVGGEVVADLTPSKAQALGIACIYQQPALFPDLSVAENIGLRLEKTRVFSKVNWGGRRKRAAELLARIGAEISPEVEVGSLSMPEQQLVEIACALGAGARIVIMDEPTASLTQKEQHLLYKVVRDLRDSGVGVVYISHRLEEIFALADRVTVLRDGESIGTNEAAELSEASLIRMMVGREVEALYPPGCTEAGEVVLRLEDISCADGGVEGVSLEVKAGEVLGVAGLVGAGRTELARVLFGISPADGGRVFLGGKEVGLRSPREAIANGIAYVPEDRRKHGVILEMPVSENITMASHGSLFPAGLIRGGIETEVAKRFVSDLGIKTADTISLVGSLSGGNQQKVSVARWLATEPKLLILDEPTQGVDVGAKGEIHRIIRELAESGLAVVMISSDLTEVLGMSDRVAVMRQGRLEVVLQKNEADAQSVMAAALGSGEVVG